jgi:tetratricopeptide (TPR) repeat protein
MFGTSSSLLSKTQSNDLIDENRLIVFLFIGNKHFLQKKYNDAIHCYNQALKQNGEKATYYVNRALCYIKLKQWDKVYQDARHSLDLDPNYIKAHAYLGQYYLEQQRYDEAIVSFKQAFELSKVCFVNTNKKKESSFCL